MMHCHLQFSLTLKVHYSKHYLSDTNGLNAAIAGTPYQNQVS
jgi:hypothetical protein